MENRYKKIREDYEFTEQGHRMTMEELADIFKSKGYPTLTYSAIRKIETDNRNVSEYELKGYCEVFNTTADYLLGFDNVASIDENIRMIGKTIGFSDISIDRLKKYTKLQRDIVDKLLSTKAMDKIIDAYIYRNSQYFQKIEIIDSICGKRTASDKENSDFHFFQSVEMLKEAINIISSDKELFYELNDIHGEKAGERLWKIAIDIEIMNIGIEKTLANLIKDKKNVPGYVIEYVKELQKKQKGSDV